MDAFPIPILPQKTDNPEGGLLHPEHFPVPKPAPPGSYAIPQSLAQLFQAPDYGADSHHRVRYQAACAAVYALPLLDHDPPHVAVYCELLEDILIKLHDGGLFAIQVKTRDKGLDPFKTSDREILSSLRRFADYESKEGCRFRRYIMASNCGFWHKDHDWKNIEHLERLASGQPPDEASMSKVCDAIRQAIREACSQHVDGSVLAAVLCKLKPHGCLPTCGEERPALLKDLRKYTDNLTIDEMELIVADVIEYVCSFSSRDREDRIGARVVLAADPATATLAMRLSSKCITAQSLRARLDEAVVKARSVVRYREDKAQSVGCSVDEHRPAFDDPQELREIAIEQINTIKTLRDQLERQKASDAASRLLAWLKENETRLSGALCFEAYMLIADVEAEIARRETGPARDAHLQTSRIGLEKAKVFSAA